MTKNMKKNSILLIDSDISVTDLLSTRLTNVGFDVLVANDAVTATNLLKLNTPDLILLDILMKGMEGKDILTLVKTNIEYSNIPIIILSSDIDINSKVYSFLSGANDYIVKPFRFAEVLARINTQIRLLTMQKELEDKNKELIEKNLLLQQLALTDQLTGLHNRTYVLDRLNTEILRSARYKESISFIMIDVDFFKNVNDVYGHLAGDALLKIVATQLKNSIRDIDICGRYGGEEFIVVCPNTDVKGAQIIAERIRVNTQNDSLNINGKKTGITLSLGISSSIPKLPLSIDKFISTQINCADIALYKAKSNGRNRVEVYNCSDISESHSVVASKMLDESTIEDKYTH